MCLIILTKNQRKVIKFNHVSGNHLNIEDAKIYYEVVGKQEKPVLLFLHGGFGNIEEFNGILSKLEQDYTIIGIDSRGQGKSTLGSKKLTYQQIQEDVEQVLNYLNIDRLSSIGFSDGGIVGYRLASMTSLNIEKLITIGADWHSKNLESVRGLFQSITAESWKTKFPESYETYRRLNPEPDFKELTESMIPMWLDSSASGFPNENVQNISCPLLIVRGDEDHLCSRKTVFELSEAVEHSSLLNIPFAGHVVFDDQREIFMKILNEFLKE